MRANFSSKLLLVFLFPFSDEGSSLSLHMPVGFMCAGLGRFLCYKHFLFTQRFVQILDTSQPFQLFTKIGITEGSKGSRGGASTHKERGNILLDIMNIFNFLYDGKVLPSKSALE